MSVALTLSGAWEWLWESATEFCAALNLYAERAMQIKRENK
jgi:hypothetical protein